MPTTRWMRVLAACLAAVFVAAFLPAGAANAQGPRPEIPAPVAVGAPIGHKGGVLNPFVSCSRYSVDPRVKWTLTSVETGASHTYRWTGALPGVYFPRVPAGAYRSTTTAWCRGERLTRTHAVRVVQKTRATTISRAEFRRIHHGMTRARVRHVVGFDAKACGTYAARTTCIYDMMPFWAWATVTYRDGRVVAKQWDVDHD